MIITQEDKDMNKTTKYAWYNTIGLQETLNSIDEISAEYNKRLNFFKTLKTNTIYCENSDYPRLFHVKRIDWDKLRFKGTSVTLADNAIYEKEDSFPLDFLLKCEELVDFQDTYKKMVEEIKSIEKRKEMNYKLFSKLIKEKKKHNDIA